VLRVGGLRKAYGEVVALDGVDLEIGEGEICALLGPNGAGKTTLVSIIVGLRHADDGEVWVGEVDAVHDVARARALIGIAPQELGIYPGLTVRENLVFFGELNGVRGRDLITRIEVVAEALELGDLLDRTAQTLSGGEKRRVHTGNALLHRPPLLLLDEPTTGVDVRTRAHLLEAVRALAAEHGTAICYSTHYLPEVDALGASVAILERGKIIARGSVADLVGKHGGAAVELTFDGAPPTVVTDRRTDVDGSILRVFSEDPGVEAATLLSGLGADAHRLRSVEIVAPSLESVFLALTGRRYESGEEVGDVVAS
jgi:ABC-2 type transport system ATP-binding protein